MLGFSVQVAGHKGFVCLRTEHAGTDVCLSVRRSVCMYVCLTECTYVHVFVHVYLYILMQAAYPCIHAYIHTYIRTYIHTYTHTHMLTCTYIYIHTYSSAWSSRMRVAVLGGLCLRLESRETESRTRFRLPIRRNMLDFAWGCTGLSTIFMPCVCWRTGGTAGFQTSPDQSEEESDDPL